MEAGACIGALHEHRYTLRVRCSGCPGEAHPIVSLGMARLARSAVEARIRRMVCALPFECPRCGGEHGRLVAYFPVRSDGRADLRVTGSIR